jgi:hypothetical protein
MAATREMYDYFRARQERWLRAALIAEQQGNWELADRWLGFAADYAQDAAAELRSLTGRTS